MARRRLRVIIPAPWAPARASGSVISQPCGPRSAAKATNDDRRWLAWALWNSSAGGLSKHLHEEDTLLGSGVARQGAENAVAETLIETRRLEAIGIDPSSSAVTGACDFFGSVHKLASVAATA